MTEKIDVLVVGAGFLALSVMDNLFRSGINNINSVNRSIKNIKLPVSAPFHCDLMSNATKKMIEELSKLNFKNGENKLISNVTASEIKDPDELKSLLIKQIENRVRWRESVINMIENNVNHFIEIGPGKVLSGLVKRISREVKIDTINSQSDIESLKI